MNCNNENTFTRTNCGCENCTPILDDNVNINDYKLTPVLLNKLYNCTSKINYEYNAPSVFLFNVAGSDYAYPNNGKVKIEKLSISYDNIGLPLSTTNSTKVYFNGELMDFTPENLMPVNFQGVPFYLFNDLTKRIVNKPTCCCNNEETQGTLVTISQKNQIFVTSNLKIYAYGCINDLPFSAVTQFDILSTSQTLGFSSFNMNSKLCWPNQLINGRVLMRYNPTLCANSICPITNYSPPVTPDTNGFFYAITNLLFFNNIEIYMIKNESVPLITNDYNSDIFKNNLNLKR